MIRNAHNPFADPTLCVWFVGILFGSVIIKYLLGRMASMIGLWSLTVDARIRFDNADLNKMDANANMKRLIKNA